ncbi:MAG: RecX family transcriptional regulator [Clostridia bacterium]|nr:RecX family transcriptional regulator [Clostridia bacterium]
MSDTYINARSEAIRHIGIATYSSGKIKQYLISKGYSYDVACSVVAELIKREYIDDVKASRVVLLSRTGKKQESKDFLLKRLLAAGIDEFVAEDYVYELPDDKTTIVSLYEANFPNGISYDNVEERNSALKIASRRGYSLEIAQSGLKIWLDNRH